MAEPFVGQIRMFAGNFAPRGHALCHGQALAIADYPALFSLLGTQFGGDGQTTFNLPDLRGRLPIHQGPGPGLTPRTLGRAGGTELVTLSVNQLPAHEHACNAVTTIANETAPAGHMLAQLTSGELYSAEPPTVDLGSGLAATGGGQPHSNVMPFLCVNFIIALVGIFPSRA